jgi:ethanolamine transporter EutH
VTQDPNVLFLAPAAEEEVLQIANKLKIKSSAGYHEIPNMRPISILSSFSKILETLMYNIRVVNFLHKFNLVSNAQNGFRKNKSMFTAIQTFIGVIQKTLINNWPLVYFWTYLRHLTLLSMTCV